MNSNIRSAMAGAVTGSVAMYLLDPDRGARRRALVRDKATWAVRKSRDAAGATSRDVSNRLKGLAARARVRFSPAAADDITVRERVRSALGRATPHHRAVSVAVASGWVTLTGDALASEVPPILSGVKDVRGVEGVDNQLRTHEAAGMIPSLPDVDDESRSWTEWATSGWSPTALAGTAAGAALLGAAALAATRAARRDEAASDDSWINTGLDDNELCLIEVETVVEQ